MILSYVKVQDLLHFVGQAVHINAWIVGGLAVLTISANVQQATMLFVLAGIQHVVAEHYYNLRLGHFV
jgi:hypothetical protein